MHGRSCWRRSRSGRKRQNSDASKRKNDLRQNRARVIGSSPPNQLHRLFRRPDSFPPSLRNLTPVFRVSAKNFPG